MWYLIVSIPDLCTLTYFVWRYNDDAGAIIENVYKFCMEEKKSGMKLSPNRICDRTAALTGVSRSTAQKIVEEKKKAHDEQQQPKQSPSSTSKVSLDDLDQGVVWWTIASMYSLKKVLPTLDNIRTGLKHSIGYTGSKGRLRKDLLHMKFTYTRCGENQKSADGETRCSPQQDLIPSQGQGVERGGLHRYNLLSYQPRCLEMLAR